MATRTNHVFPPVESLSQSAVTTEQAAYYLMRSPQTLRYWAMGRFKTPIQPIRINGRLAWPVATIRTILGVTS